MLVKNKMLNLAVIVFTIVSVINDCHSQTSIVTDRPDITESSFTVPKGRIQFENGFSYTRNEYEDFVYVIDSLVNSKYTDEYIVTPSTLVRYGASEGIELRFGLLLMTQSFENTYPHIIDITKTNIEGVQFAVKFKLTDQKKLLPSTAVIAGSSIPALNPGSETDLIDPAVTFCFSNEISKSLTLGYNIGLNLEDGFNSSASGAYSACLGIMVSELIGMFAEAYGFIPFTKIRASNYVDGGITILLRENLQMDFSGGCGLSSGISEYFISTGISFRLPN